MSEFTGILEEEDLKDIDAVRQEHMIEGDLEDVILKAYYYGIYHTFIKLTCSIETAIEIAMCCEKGTPLFSAFITRFTEDGLFDFEAGCFTQKMRDLIL